MPDGFGDWMGLFVRRKQPNTPIAILPTPQEYLEKKLHDSGVEYSIQGDDSDQSMMAAYRGLTDLPCVRIEITQLFSNSNCSYTYCRKEWRQNTFALETLGYIDASVTDSYEVCLSAMAPGDNVLNKDILQRKMNQVTALLVQDVSLFGRSKCLKGVKYPNTRAGECPYIIFGGAHSGFTYTVKPGVRSADYVFAMIQLFALAIHRTFGNVYKPFIEAARGVTHSEVTPQMRLM